MKEINYKSIINNWIDEEKKRTCSEDSQKRYIRVHSYRFNYLYSFIIKNFEDRSLRILDVGKSSLTILLNEYYNTVCSLGFAIDKDEGGHRVDSASLIHHIPFNLNQAREVEKWPQGNFDLIIFSEVIEHLSQAPEYALLFFHSLLNDGGCIICTTPNASALFRRYKLLVGVQPYARIRFFSENPGHYREYTKKEMLQIGQLCGYKTIKHSFVSFNFKSEGIKSRLVNFFTNIIPSFKWSQIIIFKKQ